MGMHAQTWFRRLLWSRRRGFYVAPGDVDASRLYYPGTGANREHTLHRYAPESPRWLCRRCATVNSTESNVCRNCGRRRVGTGRPQ